VALGLGFGVREVCRWVCGGGLCGLRLQADAERRPGEVSAACGALQQDVVEGGGAEDAAADVSEDNGGAAGAEMPGDEVEAGGGGAAVEGLGEVAAVGEEDLDEAEDGGEVGEGGQVGGGGGGRSCGVASLGGSVGRARRGGKSIAAVIG